MDLIPHYCQVEKLLELVKEMQISANSKANVLVGLTALLTLSKRVNLNVVVTAIRLLLPF